MAGQPLKKSKVTAVTTEVMTSWWGANQRGALRFVQQNRWAIGAAPRHHHQRASLLGRSQQHADRQGQMQHRPDIGAMDHLKQLVDGNHRRQVTEHFDQLAGRKLNA